MGDSVGQASDGSGLELRIFLDQVSGPETTKTIWRRWRRLTTVLMISGEVVVMVLGLMLMMLLAAIRWSLM